MSKELPKEVQERIERNANEYARKYSGTRLINRPYRAGAIAEASRAQKLVEDLEQKVKELTQWKVEASMLLNPILDWGQKNLKPGKNICTEVLRRAKRYQKLIEALENVKEDLEVILECDPENAAAITALKTLKGALNQDNQQS